MTATLLSQTGKITRQELQAIPVPQGTSTHQPLSHYEIVEALLETLGFRRIEMVRDEYAVSRDGMRMFGVLDLEMGITGVRFSIGVRNANDKSMRLAMCIGYPAGNGDGRLIVQAEDTLLGMVRKFPVDMVVLSTGLEPRPDA